MANIGEILGRVREILATREDLLKRKTVASEAEQIFEAVLGDDRFRPLTRTQLYQRVRDELSSGLEQRVLSFALRRAEGELLQHILGFQFFLNHVYQVGPEVLVPRPETEILVDEVSRLLEKQDLNEFHGLEIGLGSGAVSIELLSLFPGLRMVGTEISEQAGKLAVENAGRILGAKGAGRLEVLMVQAPDQIWPPEITNRKFDFIISNPPYLLGSEVEPEVVAYEPALALFAPVGDPLFFYRGLADPPMDVGFVAVEIPHERDKAILEIFENAGWRAKLLPDLSGRSRVVIANRA